ncbi:regulatory protein RecX [uncultured Roseivirga sp.]|uniref:regulatory protein RecX n=1 Tax=uncultured Roseivirga sp. TaxID=543088 RepID=UPI000D78EDD2|nr:regulatory protein RecX [uncultured Roseivirga sp.]PWL29842.1 MAG: RecX family transcriptional regulator [Roseivirga sp. XM-24bin3]
MFDSDRQKPKKTYDRKTAKLKAADFCAYQERSQQQVRDKLYDYGLHFDEVEEILTELIMEGFINEERFARAFIGGKFRMKKWGKQKILQSLRPHKISEYCIRKGLEEIDPEDYWQALLEHTEKKYVQLSGNSPYIIKGKLTQHLYAKGFESDLIREAVEQIVKD